MKEEYLGRYCSVFHCDKRGDCYCCIDCNKIQKCRNPCQNNPDKCGLENIQKSLKEDSK